MSKVLCVFDECKWCKRYDEDYGVCQRDEITLDSRVYDVMFGCPDSEWEETDDADS